MKVVQPFIQSAGALLLATAMALLLGNPAGFGQLHPHDPLLAIPLPVLFWIWRGISLALAGLCLRGRNPRFQLAGVLWFACNLSVYQIGILLQKARGFRVYLQDIAVAFGVSPALVNLLLQGLTLYLLFGSAFRLFQLWFSHTTLTLDTPPTVAPQAARDGRRSEAFVRTLKIACTKCGGHIEFSTNSFGRQVPCPHCQAVIALKKSATIKMSCAAYDSHITFPSHALGEKVACPHCTKEITLKEAT